ncbi:Pimeloyl-ACP methyl ester carboxylesterase OS=Castellaniella defragrans OX=75697 GN=HNR28_001292 PE=4 SV=1 [Castellaniella defragrans]
MTPPSPRPHPTTTPICFQGRSMEIEYRLIPAARPEADLLVFLHEGLGSTALWKGWPDELCAAAGCRGLVFSRYGYGASTPRPHDEHWPVEFMHDQAREALPALFASLGMEHERPILFGHSDGASISLLYAAMYPERVKAIAVAAPHVFVEDITIANIEQAREAYLHTDLKHKLARYHDDVDSAFWAWNDIWLNPAFRAWNIESFLPAIRCPILAIQGEDDQYGTLKQVETIQHLAPQTRLCVLKQCRHSPQVDQPQATIEAVAGFIRDCTVP